MKKLLIFVIVLFALLSIDHPIIKEPRDKILGTVMSDLSDSSKVNKEVKAKKARERIYDALSLSAAQNSHIEQHLSTNNSMARWQQKYCVDRELNEYFYGDDLMQICSIITAVSK